ncbi:probable disease resistance protein At1g12290 [Miscanthus floridulus]|uniref:probable disease resistance protein At1g12290 n=1 Tax=Miscanthus floridulus TaxID=154761 RepID=UPI00345913C2
MIVNGLWMGFQIEYKLGLLYWSYRDLSSELKQCYLFCSIFRASSQIHKDAISYWWAAEGLVSHDDLVRRNLLQLHPSYLDKSRSTTHDLLRSLSQYLSKDESMFIDARTITDSVSMLRHVGIANVGERLPAALKKIVRLRTLALFNSPNFSIINGELFRRLKHLHILILSETSIRAVPKSVKNSVHLRVLDEFGASEGSGSQLHKTPGNPKVNRATSKSSLSFIAGLQ